MGQLKKSRRGVPQKLVGSRGSRRGQERSGRDGDASPSSAASAPAGTDGGGPKDRPAQQDQPDSRGPRRPQVPGRAPLPSGGRRRRRPHPALAVRLKGQTFPTPGSSLQPNLSRVASVGSRPRTACTSWARCPSAKTTEARGRAGRRTEAPARGPRCRRAARAQLCLPD